MTETTNEIEIKLLNYPDNVRTRPSMYVGGTENPDIIFREVTDNFCDESYACPTCNKGFIHQNFNGYHLVMDNGRGLPITMSIDVPDKTQAELATGSLHAGSKFEATGVNRVGMNGIGQKATNALSNKFIVMSKITQENYDKSIPKVKEVWEFHGPRSKKDLFYYLEYHKGVKSVETAGELKELSELAFGKKYDRELPEGYSTIIMFIPDETIFDTVKSSAPVKNLQYFMLIQEKFNKRKVEVTVNDKPIIDDFQPYKYELTRTVIPAKNDKNKQVRMYMTFEVDPNLGSRETQGSINSLVINQGHHIQIAEACYREALVRHFNLTHSYIFNGLKMVVIVLAEEFLYSGQTKEICKSIVGVKSSDFGDVVKDIVKIFRTDQEYWDLHVQRLNAYAESMTSISAIDKIKKLVPVASEKGDKSRSLVPKKVAEASAPQSERHLCELYICEGNSAASTLIKARNSRYISVLPLRGRPKQTTNLDFEKVLDNKEMYDLVATVGMGMNQYYNLDSPRYGKIVIATDADDDGAVIGATLVGTVLTHMTFLITTGMLYIAESPIYKQNGKYFFPSDIDSKGNIPGLDLKKPLVRYKGLGELNTSDAKHAFFDPNSRRLIRVTPEGAEEALKILSSTSARRELMESNKLLTNPYKLK